MRQITLLPSLSMIWRMTRSQIRTSKKPMNGAKYLRSREMKMILMVPRLTSRILARKIRTGSIHHA